MGFTYPFLFLFLFLLAISSPKDIKHFLYLLLRKIRRTIGCFLHDVLIVFVDFILIQNTSLLISLHILPCHKIGFFATEIFFKRLFYFTVYLSNKKYCKTVSIVKVGVHPLFYIIGEHVYFFMEGLFDIEILSLLDLLFLQLFEIFIIFINRFIALRFRNELLVLSLQKL